MPLIIPSNSISAVGGYEVANSCRFDGSSGFSKSSVAGTRTKATFSAWIKRGTLSGEHHIFFSRIDVNNQAFIRFTSSQQIEIFNRTSGINTVNYITNSVYRDPSAWMHILVVLDTTQGTAGNRVKLFVNGTQVTSFGTETQPSQNSDLAYNTTSDTYYVGTEIASGSNYFNGYMAEVVYQDGVAGSTTDYGEFDEDSSIWKPIDVSGLTFGNSGFYLDFEDSGNLGNDVNGGTDLTENGIVATDQSTDTCTNNFATLNPLSSTASTLSEGNLKFVYASGTYSNGKGTLAVSQGKWYVEAKATTIAGTNYPGWGIADVGIAWSSNPANVDYIGQTSNQAYGFFPQLGVYLNSSNILSITDVISSGDIIGLALDLDSVQNTLKIYQNGSLLGTANINPPNNAYIFGASINTSASSAVTEFNFGNPPYTISSGNSDGNGYGNFEYAVPSGYYALCTKNLAEYG